MERWEYRIECLVHRGGDKMEKPTPDAELRYLWELDLEKQLNDLGAAGWELVDFPSDILNGYCTGWALFKRKQTKE